MRPDLVDDDPEGIESTIGALPVDAIAAELVVERATGRVRQAGAATAEGKFVLALKTRAERSLFVFVKAILGRRYLTRALHKPVCDWLTTFPPYRKLLLMPREHAKSTIVSHALPPHILIQPKERNLYFPGEDGAEQRIILACETGPRGKDHLRVQRDIWTKNELVRAFWPHRCWESPDRDSPKWNDNEYIIPRKTEWPDPSVRTIGVDGAITGAHPTVLIKDDLIAKKAANSPIVMHEAIEWHRVSRALINKPGCLEFLIGTRWATYDLYSEILEHDDTVEPMQRAMIEDGEFIYPEGGFGPAKMAELQQTFGVTFMLNYMNSASNPELTDFAAEDLRTFTLDEGHVVLSEDGRDIELLTRATKPTARPDRAVQSSQENRGQRLGAVMDRMSRRNDFLRLRVR